MIAEEINQEQTRICTKCQIEQTIEFFYINNNRKDGYNAWCKSCIKICNAEKYLKFRERYRQEQKDSYYPGKYRSGYLKRSYGITLEEYDEMLQLQNGVCGICGGNGDGENLNVDHDHETGEVRGLLCSPCNMGLGQFKESSKFLFLAGEYLEKHGR